MCGQSTGTPASKPNPVHLETVIPLVLMLVLENAE